MDTKVERKSNPILTELIQDCEEAARTNDAAVWADVADALKTATRNQAEVNISHIERNADDGDTVVVPGKVMGSGQLTKDITVAALSFTQGARAGIEASGTAQYLEDMVNEHPSGSNVKMLR